MAKIKILHIVSSLCIGGIERMAISVCNDLDRDLFDVTILVLSNNNNTLKSKLNSNVNVFELSSNQRSRGIKEIIRFFYHRSVIEDLIREIAPDIIHTHIFFYSVIPLLMSIRKAAPNAHHFHTIHTAGIHYSSSKRNAKIRVENAWFIKNGTTVVCVSKEVQRRVKYLMPSITSCLIPNYVSLENSNKIVQSKKMVSIQPIRIVYLARLVEGKNHMRLLEAFAVVVENYPNAHLRLIGDGDLRKKLQKKSLELSLEQNVEFCGQCDHIQNLLQDSDIGVFPSEYEGFSVALIEMMSFGLPMCCSDITNFRDLSIEDDDMLYFSPFDHQDIANKLLQIIRDSNLRKKLCHASVNISNNYTKEMIVPQYEMLYRAKE